MTYLLLNLVEQGTKECQKYPACTQHYYVFRQCLIYKHIYIYIFYISTYSVFTTTLGDIYFRDEQPEVQRSQVPCRGMWKIWNSNTGSVDHVSLLRMLSSVSRQDPLSCPSPGFARLFFA